ncbi:Protein disulfide-isomerase [Senna tora]|uniref:Protein disulfide-isomerase n=1 Tax=Senna tora TaxID=362788 RepID=A0A834WL78_9FABA|nr:Protein disulfide-isomerase [Senna tora]
MKYLLLLFAPILLSRLSIHCASSAPGEWQILTKQNFSSQIRLHPHILLLITVPWSGESRSLMKDVVHVIADKGEEFSPLKLRYIHRNTESMLADSVGATTDEITLVYFRYSISYKYRGRLRAKNILSSLYFYITHATEEVPLKALRNGEELRTFLDSTDKALVLVDFCGWTPKLLAKGKENGTEKGFSLHGDHLGVDFGGKNDRTPASGGKNNLKVAGEGMCKADLRMGDGFQQVPWLEAFTSVKNSALVGAKYSNSHVLTSCTLEEFEHFYSFYLEFMTAVREFSLPPERHRFGLVLERSILSSLGVGDSGSWFAVQCVAGCPSCLKILNKEDDLKYVLQMDNHFVKELEGKEYVQETILPANRPSILLFVDRSSDSSETRGKSKEALDAFRELAQHYQVLNQISNNDDVNHGEFSIKDYQGLKSTSEHPRLKLSMTAQKIKLKKKMSTIMILNEGKHISLDKLASDLQVTSLNEIFSHLLQQNKYGKLSSLAKDLGFQLLSDDIDIKPINVQKSHSEIQFNQMSTEHPQAGRTDIPNLENDPYRLSKSAGDPEENSELTELSSQNNELKTTFTDPSKEIPSTIPEEPIEDHELPVNKNKEEETEGSSDGDKSQKESIADHELPVAKTMKAETEGSSNGDIFEEEQDPFLGFNGSFFYTDSNYQLLRTLTGNSRIPTLVIIDPIQQQHFVFPEDKIFDFSSLYGFLSGFLNETLLPYQRSEVVIKGPREATHPPFVNLDFHEVDSIPRITAHTFSELVIGLSLSDKENAWNKDVLVLFSYNWCGYCQRMEMVVREVHRSFKGYMDMRKSQSRNVKAVDHENLDYVTMKLPVIYLLDCTSNDCDLILESVDQREVYPALFLFPAEKKKPILYEGDMTVVDLIKFVGEHASYVNHLICEKVLWLHQPGRRNQNLYSTLQTNNIHMEPLYGYADSKYHRSQGDDSISEKVVKPNPHNLIKAHMSNRLLEPLPRVTIGSVLIATEKLMGIQPFDASKILIVAADQMNGFQGLIINKHIGWSSLPELQEGYEILKGAPLSLGGPIVKSGMPLLSLTTSVPISHLPEVLPGVFFLDHLATIGKIYELKLANQSVADHWFFLGYSSWNWDQLFNEMAKGAWNVSEDGMKHLIWP